MPKEIIDMHRYLILFIALIATTGCQPDTKSTQAEYDFGSLADITCNDSEFQGSQYKRFFKTLPDKKREPILKRLNESRNDCAVFSEIKNQSKQLYEQLDSGVIIPKKVYLFELNQWKDQNKEAAYRAVGFFDNQETCNNYVREVKKLGYEVKTCYSRTLFWKVAWA